MTNKKNKQPDFYNINLHTGPNSEIPDMKTYNLLKELSQNHSIDKIPSNLGTKTPSSNQKQINFNNNTQEVCVNYPSNLNDNLSTKALKFKKKQKRLDSTKHASIDDKRLNFNELHHQTFQEEHAKSPGLINKNLNKRKALKKHLQKKKDIFNEHSAKDICLIANEKFIRKRSVNSTRESDNIIYKTSFNKSNI